MPIKSILQSREWAEFKKSQGFVIFEYDNIFIHKRNLPFGQNFLYLPEVSANCLSDDFLKSLNQLTRENKSIFCRIEIIDRFDGENEQKIIKAGYKRAFEQVQPKWRQIINLEKNEEEILSQMRSKGRYNIKVAQKHSVKVKTDNQAIGVFHDLYLETVKREGISGRSIEYFDKMLDSFDQTDYLETYVALYENQPVCAALVSFYDGVASYLYGGSSRRHKEVMAPYLMHWKIICDAKERGMKEYDLIGRSRPGDDNPNWAGVTRFKEQFGGEAVEIMGSYDFIAKPAFYRIFKIAEKMRRKEN